MMSQNAKAIAKFEKQNGGESIPSGNWLLYATGAMRELAPGGWGALRDPPADPLKRAKVVVRYHELRVKRAESAFIDKKNDLIAGTRIHQREGRGAPDEDELDKLKALQKEARACRRALAAAQKAFDELTPPEVKNAAQYEAEMYEEADEFLGRVMNVKL